MSSSSQQSLLDKIAQLVHYSLRPLPPRFGDGRYNSDVFPEPTKTGILKDLTSQVTRVPADVDLIVEVIETLYRGGLQNDAQYTMEKIIQFVASLPSTSKFQGKLTDLLITNLWNVLLHPPLTYVGDQYQYRSADGSCNNIMYPHLGKAKSWYAKSVKPIQTQFGAKPDPGLLFDALMARKAYKPHPNRISSMLFYLATIIIHDLFSTDPLDPTINNTTSYLDLSPLYGNNQEQQNSVRTFKDGLLKPDCFYEPRVLGFPPGVSVLLLCFNRFHNYVVEQLAQINEGGRFSMPDKQAILMAMKSKLAPGTGKDITDQAVEEAYQAALKKRDNDLFQTGRLVTCGLYINIVLNDYVRTILGLNRTNDTWNLDPRVAGPNVYANDGTPKGVGNQVSLEFNLLYRWHAAISDRDDKWTQGFAKKVFPGKDMSKISVAEFKMGLGTWAQSLDPDPGKRDFDLGEIKRDKKTGLFDDAALVKVLVESIEDCAAAFDSGVPVVLRAVEMIGIEQARFWKCATLNEFRLFFDLIKHEKFEDVTPHDPHLALKLRQFYDHPDDVELYPGLPIEGPKKPMVPGSGLCPPQTIGKAILSDAVALVRGDRFYTTDYSPALLTNWGYASVASNIDVAQGGLMYRLLMRAFPGWFEYNSVYALFPFTTPHTSKEILESRGVFSQYSLAPPKKPTAPIVFSTAKNAKLILGDEQTFNVTWGAAISRLSGGVNYMLSADKPANNEQHKQVYKALYTDVKDWKEEVWDFYVRFTEKLLNERSYRIDDFFQVDAVRDIINMVHVNFTAIMWHLPLKTEQKPLNPFTEKQLYDIFALLFGYVFLDRDETASFTIRTLAKQACDAVAELVKINVNEVSIGAWIKKLVDGIQKDGFLDSYGNTLIRRLLEQGMSIEEIVWIILPTAAAGTANQGQQSIQMLDLFLSEKYKDDWAQIVKLAEKDDAPAREKLRRYAMEGCRISTQSFGLFRSVSKATRITEAGKTYDLKPGDEIFVNLVGANLDSAEFKDPLKIDLNRPDESYVNYGWGPHHCLGKEINIVANTAILRTFARLHNLRRAPGPQGTLKYVMQQEVVKVYMQEDWGSYWFFPTTMKVHYDAK